jgi:hypothetical protein
MAMSKVGDRSGPKKRKGPQNLTVHGLLIHPSRSFGYPYITATESSQRASSASSTVSLSHSASSSAVANLQVEIIDCQSRRPLPLPMTSPLPSRHPAPGPLPWRSPCSYVGARWSTDLWSQISAFYGLTDTICKGSGSQQHFKRLNVNMWGTKVSSKIWFELNFDHT